jgi:uncharacterized protein (TIGR03089 family)
VTPSTVAQALRSLLAGDPAQPLVTYLGPGGERTELSIRTFENNVAKAANLLRDDAGVTAASRVALLLPVHWQTAVWMGACAATGCVAWLEGDPTDPSVEVSVTGPQRLDAARAPLALATSLHPFGLPFTTPLPAGLLDAAVEVRAHGDRFTPYDDVPGDAGWIAWDDRTWTQATALAEAGLLADSIGLAAGGRVLCDATRTDARSAVLAVLALPLAVGGSVVLLADPDADVDATAVRERCTAVLR